MKKAFIASLLVMVAESKVCFVPDNIKPLVVQNSIQKLLNIADVRRNYSTLKDLCVSLLSFKEGIYNWKMLLVTNPKARGPFWFLPHDNENSAFKAAIYATRKYGGGFLAIVNSDKRYFLGQDPNRNFSLSYKRVCKEQHYPSFIYTQTIIDIINSYKGSYPYLALHNNTNKGGISILKSSRYTKSFLAYPKSVVQKASGTLADEDNLVYIAGSSPKAPMHKVNALLQKGLNVKYELVTPRSYDCSLSNFVVQELGVESYFNIEAQHNATATQKRMIDLLLAK